MGMREGVTSLSIDQFWKGCNVRKRTFLAIVCSRGVIFRHCRLGKSSNLNEMDRWPNGLQIVNSHTRKTDHYTLEQRDAFIYPLQSQNKQLGRQIEAATATFKSHS